MELVVNVWGKNMRKIISFLIIIISLMLISGCDGSTSNGKLKVVTTIFPIYDMVRYIGEDLVDVSMMVAPGQDIHSYDPSTSDIINAKKSDILIYIGDAMESWVQDLSDNTNDDKKVLALSKDERICLESLEHHKEDDHEEEGHNQRVDVATIDVGVGHNDNLAISQLTYV